MRRFVVKAFWFALPLVVICAMFEAALRRMPTSYAVKRRQCDAAARQVEVLIVGPSHAEQGILPSLLRRPAFNLAFAAQDIYYDTKLVERYVPRMSRLRLVIITVSFISFEYRIADAPEPWRTHFYSLFFDIPNESWRLRFALPDKSVLALYGPEKALEYARSWFRVDLGAGGLDRDGARHVDSTLSDRRAPGDGPARFALDRRDIMHARRFDENVAVLNGLLTFLQEHQIQAALVTLPVLPAYSRLARQTASWTRMQDAIASLARQHGVRYWDYFEDSRFVTSDFANSDHLNERGALKMSRLIDDEIVGGLDR